MDITDLNMIKVSIELFFALFCLFITGMLYQITKGFSKESRALMALLLAQTGLLLCEALRFMADGNRAGWEYTLNEVCSFLLCLDYPAIAGLGICYIGLRLGRGKGALPVLLRWNIIGTTLLALVLTLANQVVPLLYVIDRMNVLHRLEGWLCYSALLGGSLLLTAGLVVKSRSLLGLAELGTFLLFCLAPLGGLALQAYAENMLLGNILCTVAVLAMVQSYLRDWWQARDNISSIATKQKQDRLLIINLTMVMVFCLLASVSLSALAAMHTAKKYNQDSSYILAHSVTEAMERVFHKSIDVSERMAASTILRQLLENPEGQEAQLTEYLQAVRELSRAEMVFAVAEKNQGYYTEHGHVRQLEGEKDSWYTEVKSHDSNYLFNVGYSNNDKLQLGAFVNVKVYDRTGRVIGVTGTCFSVESLARSIKEMEQEYNIKVYLTNAVGLVQLSSDKSECRARHVNIDEFTNVSSSRFTYRYHEDHVHLVKYIPYLNCYLVVMDYNPDKISMARLIAPSVFVLVLGMLLIIGVYRVYIRQSRKLESELTQRDRLAKCDALTGLGNRYALDCLRREPHGPDWQRDLTVVMLDVNGLKRVNDSMGHAAGDELIIGTAGCMYKVLGRYGSVFRVGGDEFIGYIHCEAEELPQIVDRLKKNISRWQGKLIGEVSAALGTASVRDYPQATLEELEAIADKEMYLDKAKYYQQEN